jgi:hypothetical protein
LEGPPTTGVVETAGVTVDSSGGVYIAGDTNAGLDGYAISGTGCTDLFVVKYNSSGTKEWTRELGPGGSSNQAYAEGIVADASNNVYLVGYSIGVGLDGNPQIGNIDGVITKYNSFGLKQWTREFGTPGGSSHVIPYGVSVDSSGSVYVAGQTNVALYGNTLTGTIDAFTVQYDSAGNRNWTQQLGASGKNTYVYGLGIDPFNGIFIGGETTGGLDGKVLIGTQDYFVTKYSSVGVKQ